MKKAKLREEKSIATNKFTVYVAVGLPEPKENYNRWLNLQYAGKEVIPFKEKVSPEHKEAAYKMHIHKTLMLSFEILKNGSWKLIKAKL